MYDHTQFVYRQQPLKTFYLFYTIVSTLFVRIPFWFFSSVAASHRGRPTWSIGRSIVIHLLQTFVLTVYKTSLPAAEDPEKAQKSAYKTGFVWVDAAPGLNVGEISELARLNGVQPARISGYWYGKHDADGAPGQRAEKNEKVVIHFHGGGYVMGSAAPGDLMTPPICNGYLEHFPQVSRVFAPEYRLSSAEPFTPANAFPAAVLDAAASYHYLIHALGFQPENIVVSGDSAGGHLAITLTRHLININQPETPPPSHLLLLSPTVEWLITHSGPDSSEQRNKATDYCRPFFNGYPARSLAGKLPIDDVYNNAWISPASLRIKDTTGWFNGFPRTCINVGEAEFASDSMRTFRDRLVTDIGAQKVTFFETFGATHDFLGFSVHEPERTEALKEMAQWMKGV